MAFAGAGVSATAYAPHMSFEEEKKRLIQELIDAQAETRAKFNMKPKQQQPKDSKDDAPKQDTPAKS
jgi:hypothetical protein